MTRLVYSEDLYILLAKVGRNIILFHDVCEPHAPGFSWVGADMTEWAQQLLTDLRHAGLVQLGNHEPWGAAVSLSPQGVDRLAQWREQRLAGLRGVA